MCKQKQPLHLVTASPDESARASADDRIEAGTGNPIPSAAFDLTAVPTEDVGKKNNTKT